jgi:hypothetical protein
MERTFDRSRRSSSNCSRMDGVIRERTISDRFSLFMASERKKSRPQGWGGKRSPNPGGGSRGKQGERLAKSCGPLLGNGEINIDRALAGLHGRCNLRTSKSLVTKFNGPFNAGLFPVCACDKSRRKSIGFFGVFRKRQHLAVLFRERARFIFPPQHHAAPTKVHGQKMRANYLRVFGECEVPGDAASMGVIAMLNPLLHHRVANKPPPRVSIGDGSHNSEIAAVHVKTMAVIRLSLQNLFPRSARQGFQSVFASKTGLFQELPYTLARQPLLHSKVRHSDVLSGDLLGEAFGTLVAHAARRFSRVWK